MSAIDDACDVMEKAARQIREMDSLATDLVDALTCWPLQDLLGLVEDSGDENMRRLARLFMEVRDAAVAKARISL
jgi:hypothetical protein